MFVIFTVFLLFLGTSSYGVPLESPTADLSQYFDSRIVGGIDAPSGIAPWMAGMRIGAVFYTFICGGSILNERHVLTAAHCIEPYVYLGAIRSQVHIVTETVVWSRGGTVSPVVDFRINPQYNRYTYKNDCGILKLGVPLDFSKGLSRPVALDWDEQGESQDCFITGWGSTEAWGALSSLKQYIVVPTISFIECEKLIKKITDEYDIEGIVVDPVLEICTLRSLGFGVCSGDSGSPVIVISSGKQIAIVSWGIMPCGSGLPDVHTAIRSQRVFIEGAMERWL